MYENAPGGNLPRPARPNPPADCPLTAAIGGKWKLTLIYWLAHGETHFAGLRRRAAPISPTVLTAQLRELEADGIVEREAAGPVPLPVVYRLTGYGAALMPLVETMRVWGAAHLARTRGAAHATACATPLAMRD